MTRSKLSHRICCFCPSVRSLISTRPTMIPGLPAYSVCQVWQATRISSSTQQAKRQPCFPFEIFDCIAGIENIRLGNSVPAAHTGVWATDPCSYWSSFLRIAIYFSKSTENAPAVKKHLSFPIFVPGIYLQKSLYFLHKRIDFVNVKCYSLKP